MLCRGRCGIHEYSGTTHALIRPKRNDADGSRTDRQVGVNQPVTLDELYLGRSLAFALTGLLGLNAQQAAFARATFDSGDRDAYSGTVVGIHPWVVRDREDQRCGIGGCREVRHDDAALKGLAQTVGCYQAEPARRHQYMT